MMSCTGNCRCTPDGSGMPVVEILAISLAMRQRVEALAVDDRLVCRQMAGARPLEVVVGDELEQPEDCVALLRRALLRPASPRRGRR